MTAYFSEPDGLSERLDDIVDVVLVVHGVCGRVVHVDGDAVDGAVNTLVHKGREPRNAHGRGAVGDGRRAELGLTREWLHVRLPRCDGILGAHVGLLAVVRLVETADQMYKEEDWKMSICIKDGRERERRDAYPRRCVEPLAMASVAWSTQA